tara:strand:- start:277 stop:480 length:204 start_codon:yes stop_codon:yes gene_type:complete
MGISMGNVTIDGTGYDLDEMSDNAKAQLESLVAVDKKIGEMQQDMAILQTARNAYAVALRDAIADTD